MLYYNKIFLLIVNHYLISQMSIANHYNLVLEQLDKEIFFLLEILKETIYVTIWGIGKRSRKGVSLVKICIWFETESKAIVQEI